MNPSGNDAVPFVRTILEVSRWIQAFELLGVLESVVGAEAIGLPRSVLTRPAEAVATGRWAAAALKEAAEHLWPSRDVRECEAIVAVAVGRLMEAYDAETVDALLAWLYRQLVHHEEEAAWWIWANVFIVLGGRRAGVELPPRTSPPTQAIGDMVAMAVARWAPHLMRSVLDDAPPLVRFTPDDRAWLEALPWTGPPERIEPTEVMETFVGTALRSEAALRIWTDLASTLDEPTRLAVVDWARREAAAEKIPADLVVWPVPGWIPP